MSCQLVLPLSDIAEEKQASGRPTQKKDRRKLRRQQWIESKCIMYTSYNVLKIGQLQHDFCDVLTLIVPWLRNLM